MNQRTQDRVNQLLMVVGAAIIVGQMTIIGYFLTSERSELRTFRQQILQEIDELQDKVTALEIRYSYRSLNDAYPESRKTISQQGKADDL